MPNAQCPLPHARCPLPHARCPLPPVLKAQKAKYECRQNTKIGKLKPISPLPHTQNIPRQYQLNFESALCEFGLLAPKPPFELQLFPSRCELRASQLPRIY